MAKELVPTAEQAATLLRSSLALFEREPARYALRPGVAAVLRDMLAACSGGGEAEERAVREYDDRVAYREGEALYVLALQRSGCQRVLEGMSYKALPATPAAGAGSSSCSRSKEGTEGRGSGAPPAAPPSAAAAAAEPRLHAAAGPAEGGP
ncbi:hypothetical protein Agub_g9648, partial [Astrephomene gubernaculifera]